jgi:hypothetical protein
MAEKHLRIASGRLSHPWVASFASVWLVAVAAQSAPAAEIDSITGRTLELEDASRKLDERLEAWLEEGIERANDAGDRCDEEALYRGIRQAIARPFVGHSVAEALNADDSLARRRVLMAESIYRDLGLLDAISVHVKDLSAVVRVGDSLIGVDKLGHFLVEGWAYYDRAHREGRGLDDAMDWGEFTERTYFGRYTTGVFSYADLVADFEGMRFWSHLLGRADDPLPEGWLARRPYVTCGRGLAFWNPPRWRQRRSVRIERYIGPAWDEATNCSSYRNEEIERRVAARIEERGVEDDVDYTCPIDPRGCAEARERYGELAPRLLHPACLAAEAPGRAWWRRW